MVDRLTCLVPFCGRTRKPFSDEPEEWICDHHYAALPLALRSEYESAWIAADKADRLKSDDWLAYRRVTQAWERCKAAVLRMALS